MYLPTNAGEMKKELTDVKSLFLIGFSGCMQSGDYSKAYLCKNGYDGNPKTSQITPMGVGQAWTGFFKGPSTVYQVRVLNRGDCCGERLAGTEVFIGTQKCGKITGTPATGKWYTVTCPNPMQDSYVKLVTTNNTWLQTSGIEVYGTSDYKNAEPQTEQKPEPKPEKLLKMTKCAQSGTFNSSYPCKNGYDGNDKTSQITKAGVGQWWKGFFSGEKTVNKVMVRNRADCCGERLTGTEVYVGTKLCGKITGTTVTAKWYTVTCSEPVKGSFVKLVTTTPTWLQTSGMKVYGTD